MVFMEVDILIDSLELGIFKIKRNKKEFLLKEKLIIPKSFDTGSKLNYLKKFITVIINQYGVNNSNINVSDLRQKNIIDLVKFEGAVEEVLSNCGVLICK